MTCRKSRAIARGDELGMFRFGSTVIVLASRFCSPALALPADFPQRSLLQEIVFGVVLFTLVIQGTTTDLVVRRAGARDEER